MKLEDKLNELRSKKLIVFSYPDNVQNALIVEISTKGIPELAHGFNIDKFFREITKTELEDYVMIGFTTVQIYLTFHKINKVIK